MSENQKKTFEWYQSLIELGKFEVQHGRTRFFDTAKLHLTILAGMLALASYGIANKDQLIFFLAIFVAVFGAINAIAWWKQIESSSTWESRWYSSVAGLEEHEDFRKVVGADSVKAWSHEEVKCKLLADTKKSGASPRIYRCFVASILIFYIIFALSGSLYRNQINESKENTISSTIQQDVNKSNTEK